MHKMSSNSQKKMSKHYDRLEHSWIIEKHFATQNFLLLFLG